MENSIKKGKLDYSLLVPLFYGFWIVYNLAMVFNVFFVVGDSSFLFYDFTFHNEIAKAIVDDGFIEYLVNNNFVIQNLYHEFCAFISIALDVDINIASGIVVLSMQMLFIISVHYWASKHMSGYSDKLVLFVVAVTALAGSIPNLFGPHFMYYYGFGVHVWHNPTSFSVKPFVIMSFFLFHRVIVQSDAKNPQPVTLALLTVVLLLSVYGKPSWFPAFSVAALAFLLFWYVRSWGGGSSFARLKQCVLIGLCFIPAGMYAIYLATSSIYKTEFVFQLSSYIKPLPLLINLSFPIMVLILRFKHLKQNRLLQIAWLTYASALIQGLFIVQPSQEASGNLTWAILYSMFVLIMVSLMEFIKHTLHEEKMPKLMGYIGFALSSMYAFGGLYYAFHAYTKGTGWY